MAKQKTWAEMRYEELMAKGKANWDEDDYEAYCYIENCWGQDETDAEYLSNYSVIY